MNYLIASFEIVTLINTLKKFIKKSIFINKKRLVWLYKTRCNTSVKVSDTVCFHFLFLKENEREQLSCLITNCILYLVWLWLYIRTAAHGKTFLSNVEQLVLLLLNLVKLYIGSKVFINCFDYCLETGFKRIKKSLFKIFSINNSAYAIICQIS